MLHQIPNKMEAFSNALIWKMREATQIGSIMNLFSTIRNDEERVVFLLNLMQRFDAIPTAKDMSKDSIHSAKLRVEGNKLFVTTSLNGYRCIEILKLYTKSIAFAPCSSNELALAYANRSAVLLKIHKYAECIQDIDRALLLPYPDELKAKLYVRRIECLISIGESSIEENHKSAMHWMEIMTLDDPKRKQLKTKLQQLQVQAAKGLRKKNLEKPKKQNLTLRSHNIEVPCALDAIAIKYDDHYGRQIVAVRDISPGEVIAIENPYSRGLNPDCIESYCYNCQNVSWANIPCDYCTYAMYCSEKCKLEDWKKTHEIECPIVSMLASISWYPELHLFCLKMTIQAVKEFNSLEDLRAELNEVDKCDDPRTKGFSSDKTFKSNKYRSLYSLTTQVEKLEPEELFKMSLSTCYILYLLATCTTMFGDKLQPDLSLLAKNNDAIFVGRLILKHQQKQAVNFHSIQEEYESNVREIGIAALPFCCLFYDCCDPNVLRFSRSENVVLYMAYGTKKGEQLFDSYSQHYAVETKKKGKLNLLRGYHFICNCTPCKEDWPTLLNLPSYLDTVRNQRSKSIIKSALMKYPEYRVLAVEGNIFDKPYIMQDLFKMTQVLDDHAPLPSRELALVIQTIQRVQALLHGKTCHIPVI